MSGNDAEGAVFVFCNTETVRYRARMDRDEVIELLAEHGAEDRSDYEAMGDEQLRLALTETADEDWKLQDALCVAAERQSDVVESHRRVSLERSG